MISDVVLLVNYDESFMIHLYVHLFFLYILNLGAFSQENCIQISIFLGKVERKVKFNMLFITTYGIASLCYTLAMCTIVYLA